MLAGQVEGEPPLHDREESHLWAMDQQTFDELDVGQVVLDVEHDAGFGGPVTAGRGGLCQVVPCQPFHRALRNGEFDPKRAAPAQGAFRAEPASHRLNQSLGKGKAEPRALDPCLLGPQALEGRKQPFQSVGRDARAGVDHLEPQPARRGGRIRKRDRAPLAVVFDRVGEEVQQHLLEPLRVGQNVLVGGIGCSTVEEPDVPLRGEGFHQVEGLSHDVPHRHRLRGDGQPARLDARDVQHLVDQPEEVASPLHDISDALALLGVEGVHLQHLGEAQDGVQRGAQLVAHPREKFALRPVCRLGSQLRRPAIRHAALQLPAARLEHEDRAPVVAAEEGGEDRGGGDGDGVRDDGEVVAPVVVDPTGRHIVEDPVMEGGEQQDDPAEPPVIVDGEERQHHEEVEVHLDRPAAQKHEEVGIGREGEAGYDPPDVVILDLAADERRNGGRGDPEERRDRGFPPAEQAPGERRGSVQGHAKDRVRERHQGDEPRVPPEDTDEVPIDRDVVHGGGVVAVDVGHKVEPHRDLLDIAWFPRAANPAPRSRRARSPARRQRRGKGCSVCGEVMLRVSSVRRIPIETSA